MSVSRRRANRTTITVVNRPADDDPSGDRRQVVVITLRVGREPNSEEHLALQNFLHAIKRVQDTVGQTPFSR